MLSLNCDNIEMLPFNYGSLMLTNLETCRNQSTSAVPIGTFPMDRLDPNYAGFLK